MFKNHKPNDDSTYYHSTVPHREANVLNENMTVDVCIIGGGLAGLSAAINLVKRNKSVVILEETILGERSASGRNGGFVLPGYATNFHDTAKKIGFEHMKELYKFSMDGVSLVDEYIKEYEIDCDMTRGALEVSWLNGKDDEIRQEIDFYNKNFNTEFEFWNENKVSENYISAHRYGAAIFDPNAFTLNPLKYCYGLADAAQNKGAYIFDNSKAIKLEYGDKAHYVYTEYAKVECKHIIIAGSGFLKNLENKIERAAIEVETYINVTEPLGDNIKSSFKAPYGICDNRNILDYYRPLPDTRVLWGGRANVMPLKEFSDKLEKSMKSIYPHLADAKIEYSWSGKIQYGFYKMPQVGHLTDRIWYTMGYGGHGLNNTAIIGKILSDAIVDNDKRYLIYSIFKLQNLFGKLGQIIGQFTYWKQNIDDYLSK